MLALAQQRQHRVGHSDDSDHVSGVGGGHVLGAGLARRPSTTDADPCVVDQHIQPPGLGGDPSRGGVDAGLIGDIESDHARLTAVAGDRFAARSPRSALRDPR